MGRIAASVRSVMKRSNAQSSLPPLYTVPTAKEDSTIGIRSPKAQPFSLKEVHHGIAFSSGNLEGAKKKFDSILAFLKQTDSRIGSIRYCNSILKSYTSVSTLSNSIAFLSYMISTASPSFSPDLSTFHVLLSTPCNGNEENALDSVRKALNFMVQSGLHPTQLTTDLAVRSICSGSDVEDAVSLVKEMCSKNAKPDIFTYNFLIKHLCKNRTVSFVYSFIEEMKRNFSLTPDLVTYTILIDSVCNSKNLREALRLVSLLKESGYKPDRFVFNTIMKGFCKVGKGGEVLRVYNQMKEEGIEPDLVTYNTLIYGLATSGRVKESISYFKAMVKSGQNPDAVTYTSLMNGMCREGDAVGAMSLMEEMKDQGCPPTFLTYNTLLQGLCRSRLLGDAVKLYKTMKDNGVQFETAAYAALVRAYCKEGMVASAYEAFDYAVESKSLTAVSAYSALETTLKWVKKSRSL